MSFRSVGTAVRTVSNGLPDPVTFLLPLSAQDSVALMFDADLVRYLCGKLSDEQDPERFEDLLSTLHAVVRSDTEDIRLRMAYLLRHYPGVVDEAPNSEAA